MSAEHICALCANDKNDRKAFHDIVLKLPSGQYSCPSCGKEWRKISKPDQCELPLFQEKPTSQNVEWFVSFIEGRDWITAAQLLAECCQEITENNKRKLRALADASGGRICGHQKGYKLVRSMTQEEYTWWRNEVLKISAALEGRVLESDKIFYGRQAVPS